MSITTRKKTVSFSQFSSWWTCPYKWMRDNILKEKVFEDSIHMSFGTAIHETIQAYLTAYLNISEEEANKINTTDMFLTAFKREITKKSIKHTPEEFAEFENDGKAILSEFLSPSNVKYHFSRDKWELMGIELDIREPILNNIVLNGKLDIVLKEKHSENIRIVDLKTSGRGWTSNDKEDFTKNAQLRIYKALYSKKYNIPLSKIHVEFMILRRKLYENCQYDQSRIQVFTPSTYQSDILQVIQEFRQFVEHCFTAQGVHNVTAKYSKLPGEKKKNCKWCAYAKNGKCNQIPDIS